MPKVPTSGRNYSRGPTSPQGPEVRPPLEVIVQLQHQKVRGIAVRRAGADELVAGKRDSFAVGVGQEIDLKVERVADRARDVEVFLVALVGCADHVAGDGNHGCVEVAHELGG